MRAPDKIYLFKVELEERWPGITEASELNPKEEECYIRKNALLEWAKVHKCVIETHGDERDAYLRGEYSMLNSLIDKLNSL